MSSFNKSPSNEGGKTPKRALPSWMSARDNEDGKKREDDTLSGGGQVDDTHKKARGQGKAAKDNAEEFRSGKQSSSAGAGPSSTDFSKLMEGVVFALSGFVNPERGTQRSQALEMGAEYQPDWNSNCTLLVCAFPNTPKFRQVEADCGTIVSKDWIRECYAQKKLVDIDTYLMHVGKPWRKSNITRAVNQVHETSSPSKSQKQELKHPRGELNASTSSKELRGDTSKSLKVKFSASKVKKWAIDDLNKTLSWLESQEVKPEPSEMRNVAAEGVLTCLQDAIELLEKKQDLQQLKEQWNMIPHLVEQLIEFQGTVNSSLSSFWEDLSKQALNSKKIYEGELKGISDGSTNRGNKGKGKDGTTQEIPRSSVDYDSDDTVEMTEEEVNHAYNSIASKIPKS